METHSGTGCRSDRQSVLRSRDGMGTYCPPSWYWLMGARRTITIDINPYLKTELVREILDHIRAHTTDVRALFGALLHQKRLDDLLQFATHAEFSLARFLNLCCIEHIAPGDAARTGLPARSVDFHTSYTVIEHIPPEVLRRSSMKATESSVPMDCSSIESTIATIFRIRTARYRRLTFFSIPRQHGPGTREIGSCP